LRGVRNSKVLVNPVASHPDNPVAVVDNQGHQIAVAARHFAIHKEILQLLLAAEPKGSKPVARPAIPDRERRPAHITAHHGNGEATHLGGAGRG